MLNEQKALDKYLKIHKSNNLSDELLKNNDEFRKLLSPQVIFLDEELERWSKEEYKTNSLHKENLIHKSNSGNKLRSKAESDIDSALYDNHIPYRYEAALKIGNKTIYPDFTIRHPVTDEFYYWEHFGLMDNPEYAKKAFAKLQLYYQAGIIPSINLIVTYETKDHPLTIDSIRKIINEYFMD